MKSIKTIAYMIRDLVSEDWIRTMKSMPNRRLNKSIISPSNSSSAAFWNRISSASTWTTSVARAWKMWAADLDKVIPAERDPGLGNGGLGRLAACFIDSLAALQLQGHGNSIRYQYGLFNQRIVDNQQVELPDNWLVNGYPWEVKKVDKAVYVRFGGNAYMRPDEDGNLECVHESIRLSAPSRMMFPSSAITTTRSTRCACGALNTRGNSFTGNCPSATGAGPSAIRTASSRFPVSSILTTAMKMAAACA